MCFAIVVGSFLACVNFVFAFPASRGIDSLPPFYSAKPILVLAPHRSAGSHPFPSNLPPYYVELVPVPAPHGATGQSPYPKQPSPLLRQAGACTLNPSEPRNLSPKILPPPA
ncbi:hypothetical protein PCANC_16931 [Puccinia coronata f. sp. avenae]|uniref:Secreted protein n=1 Tax=Puccinia coronata f. sp. avenae TaxID=200324 RepID=A0A2N5V5L2_9BASI|nr:hypothetical protein PCANC_16931 [Puccinia coronata f. sp. avenae]